MKIERLNTAIPKNNKWHEGDIRTKAAELDIKPSDLVLRAIETVLGFDHYFIERIILIAANINVPICTYIENTIIKEWVREDAMNVALGTPTRLRPEFHVITDAKGTRMMTGKELYRFLYDDYCVEQSQEW